MKRLNVAHDTNVMGKSTIGRIKASVCGLPIDLVHVSVTARKLDRTSKPRIMPVGRPLIEIGVHGESSYGMAAYAERNDGDLLERLLAVISSKGFPPVGNREHLTLGQRSQLRDAMILAKHFRSGADILVTNDKKAFIGKDGSRRRELEIECSTRIMTVGEFCAYCDTVRASDAGSMLANAITSATRLNAYPNHWC